MVRVSKGCPIFDAVQRTANKVAAGRTTVYTEPKLSVNVVMALDIETLRSLVRGRNVRVRAAPYVPASHTSSTNVTVVTPLQAKARPSSVTTDTNILVVPPCSSQPIVFLNP